MSGYRTVWHFRFKRFKIQLDKISKTYDTEIMLGMNYINNRGTRSLGFCIMRYNLVFGYFR